MVFTYHRGGVVRAPLLNGTVTSTDARPLVDFNGGTLRSYGGGIPARTVRRITLTVVVATKLISGFAMRRGGPGPRRSCCCGSSLTRYICCNTSLFPRYRQRRLRNRVISFNILYLLACSKRFRRQGEVFRFGRDVKLPYALNRVTLAPSSIPTVTRGTTDIIR